MTKRDGEPTLQHHQHHQHKTPPIPPTQLPPSQTALTTTSTTSTTSTSTKTTQQQKNPPRTLPHTPDPYLFANASFLRLISFSLSRSSSSSLSLEDVGGSSGGIHQGPFGVIWKGRLNHLSSRSPITRENTCSGSGVSGSRFLLLFGDTRAYLYRPVLG